MGVKVEKNDLRKRKLFLEGNILQGVLSVCVPMAAFQLLNEIFRVFDLAITARINPESVTAVSFYNQLGNSIASFAMGLSMGAGILIAGYYGAGEYEKVKKTVNTTFFLAGSAGVVLAVLLIAAGRPILRLANTPDELIRIGWDYYRLVILNLILVFFNNVYIAIEKARGNGSRILAVNLLMAASKFAISWFLVVIMGKGIVAVAVSTLAANLFVSCTGLYFLRDPEDAFGLSPGYITLCPAFLHKIFHISLPIMAEKFAFSAGKVMVNSLGVEYGTQTVGALGVSNSISSLSTVPAGSIGDGGAAIIRQNIGGGNKERALKVFWDRVRNGYNLGCFWVCNYLALSESNPGNIFRWRQRVFTTDSADLCAGDAFQHFFVCTCGVDGVILCFRLYATLFCPELFQIVCVPLASPALFPLLYRFDGRNSHGAGYDDQQWIDRYICSDAGSNHSAS